MKGLDRIIHVLSWRRKHGRNELDMLIMFGLARLERGHVTDICAAIGGHHTSVLQRLRGSLLPDGLVKLGPEVVGGNNKRVKTYCLTNAGERAVVEMLDLRKELSGE